MEALYGMSIQSDSPKLIYNNLLSHENCDYYPSFEAKNVEFEKDPPSELNLNEFQTKKKIKTSKKGIIHMKKSSSNSWYLLIAIIIFGLLLFVIAIIAVKIPKFKKPKNNLIFKSLSVGPEINTEETSSFDKHIMSVSYKESKKLLVSHFKDKIFTKKQTMK